MSTAPLPEQTFAVVNQQGAAKTANQKGKAVLEGHAMNRLVIGDTTNTGLYVATSKIDLQKNVISRSLTRFIEKHFTCVPLKVGDDKILVNINSLSKRLHMSASEIKAASKSGNLETLVAAKAKTTENILATYKELVIERLNSPLLRKISNETLMKAATHGVNVLNTLPKGSAYTISIGKDLNGKDRRYILSINSGRLPPSIYERTKELGDGQGSASDVFRLHTIDQPEAKNVVKEAKSESTASEAALQNEVKRLKEINKNGPVPGLPRDPLAIIFIHPTNKKKPDELVVGGLIVQEIDGTLANKGASPPSNAEGLKAFAPVINGLVYLHANKLLHRDVKPENVFFKGEEVYLSDMGGVVSAKELSQSPIARNQVTPVYNSDSEVQWLNELCGVDEHLTPSEDLIHEIGEGQDIFATGVSLYQYFLNDSGALPYPIKQDWEGAQGFLDTGWDFNAPTNQDTLNKPTHLPQSVDPDIRALVESMLDPNPAHRPSMSEVQAKWQSIQAKAEYA